MQIHTVEIEEVILALEDAEGISRLEAIETALAFERAHGGLSLKSLENPDIIDLKNSSNFLTNKQKNFLRSP